MIKLQSTPGVYTVVGPMCYWDMTVVDKSGRVGTPRKRTKWVTNSIDLASALDVICRNELGDWASSYTSTFNQWLCVSSCDVSANISQGSFESP